MLSTFTEFSFPRSTQLRPFNISLIYVPLLSPLLASVYLRSTCLRVRVISLFLLHFLITFSMTFSHCFLLLRFFVMSLFLRYFLSRLTDPVWPLFTRLQGQDISLFFASLSNHHFTSSLFALCFATLSTSLFIPFPWPHLTSLNTPPNPAYFILLLHFLTSFIPADSSLLSTASTFC